ncbi:MAG: hypothetical protein BGP21_02175 [Thiobacillus sp. 65-29]|nr:MAG: hypothetical protein BGP21_02175 [Thiobacillus sp. 65-29]
MSTLFNWNETFLTGLPAIDHQHQRLVELINDLGELVMSSDAIDTDAFAFARDALLDYVGSHFSGEEALMEKACLDRRHLEQHRAAHHAFTQEALVLGESGQGITADRARELVDFLVNWLAYHILGVDQSMARQMRAIESGQTPQTAYDEDLGHTQARTEPLLAALSGLFQLVSERNRALRALNQELDERVRQRTAELERANQQLHVLSIRDDLTALPNRRFAISALDELWREARHNSTPLSVLMLDADRFKQVNDTFGHATGDAILRALATRLQDAVRTSDIVCRLGGDEFLVICPRSPRDGATQVAEKILASRAPFHAEDGTECWNGAISIGVAEVQDNMMRPEDLLRAADDALYIAKRQGGAQASDG